MIQTEGDVKDRANIEAGNRLRAARRALGYAKIRAFAEFLDESEDNFSNWERGVSQIPVRVAAKLKRFCGITSDWVYIGDPSGLPRAIADKIVSEMRMIDDDDD